MEKAKSKYKEYLNSELEAAAMYEALASIEKVPERAQIFRELVKSEMKHARRWADKLGIDPGTIKPRSLGPKNWILHIGARLFGTNRVLPILLHLEAKETDAYLIDPEARDLVMEERQHSKTLSELSGSKERGHVSGLGIFIGNSGGLRAAVLGMNDGLVSNFSLVMGVAGGTGNHDFILIAGIAGLLAGAFSMAAGEYVSMRSQRDVYEYEILKEEIELREWPDEEKEELILIYQAKGLSREEAEQISERVISNHEVALDTMAREELGLDPSSLGAPWLASASSFLSFVCGASIPIAPFIFGIGSTALIFSSVLSGSALVFVGGFLSSLSGKSVVKGGIRMLFAGGLAATVTYSVGSLIGVAIN